MKDKEKKGIWAVANREVRRLVKGKIYWFCMLIAPLISVGFFVSLMHEGLPTDLPIAVVDLDNSSNSRSLARQLNAFEGTEIIMQSPNFQEARQAMQAGDIYGIFLIPADFARDAASGKQPKLTFYTNNSFLIAGSLLFRDMKTISVLASGAVVLQTGLAKGYGQEQIMAQVQPIRIDCQPIGNPWLNYSVYLNNIILPGILALLIMCVTVYSIGMEIKERTKGEWLRTGNDSIIKSLLGKMLPQTLIFFISGLLMFTVLYLFMGFPLNSGMGPMLLALLLLILSSQALGVFMIGVLPTLRLGLSFACIWGMIAFSASGFSFPVSAMYAPLQALTNLFPLRHYFLIYVDQALNGRDFFYSMPQYLALLAFLILPFFTMKNLKQSLIHSSYIP
ncbi:ABC transporter permease [Bacteroidales bacterium OttesenSCG-928-J19]|nr:ABC transporter permease [Bacteroidales bacterium OttesenSCG-928-J19]